MPRNDPTSAAIYASICRRMIESGEWERIAVTLSKRLNELGWIDDMHHQTKEIARQAGASLSVRQLLEQAQPHAEASVPAGVRQEIIATIRQYLDGQIEK